MVMGYASQLESNKQLPEEERQKAAVIVKQSQRMKNLINDLNLASKLEYNMQPTHIAQVNLISVVRQVVVDFINLDISGKYPIEWLTDSDLNTVIINADKDLIKRAVSNLIQNSIKHNENGCTIYVAVEEEHGKVCCISGLTWNSFSLRLQPLLLLPICTTLVLCFIQPEINKPLYASACFPLSWV